MLCRCDFGILMRLDYGRPILVRSGEGTDEIFYAR